MLEDEKKFNDIRIRQRYIDDGSITKEEYQNFLESLPDVSSKVDEEYQFDFSSVRKKNKGEQLSSPCPEDASSEEN